MKKILAIGGAVIKTARDELKQVVEMGEVEALIHNGASLFHDFQLAMPEEREKLGNRHSYPLDELIDDHEKIKKFSIELVDRWFAGPEEWDSEEPGWPEGSITDTMHKMDKYIALFVAPYTDFWWTHAMEERIEIDVAFCEEMSDYFDTLVRYMREESFHYICMCSAVIHPEVFIKALAVAKPKHEFRADVVDFREMYRPRSRVAKYGKYYRLPVKEFLREWIEKGYPE